MVVPHSASTGKFLILSKYIWLFFLHTEQWSVELQLPACGCHGILRAGEPPAADHLYRDEILCIRKYFYHRIVLDVAPASSSCVGDSFSFIIGIIYIIIGRTEEGVATTTEMTALGTKGLYPLPQSRVCAPYQDCTAAQTVVIAKAGNRGRSHPCNIC